MKKRILWTLSVLFILFLMVLFTVLWGFHENTVLTVNNITLVDDALPNSFDGFRIAHVSDLHNAQFGENNDQLLQALEEAQPDIIAFTGDMVDGRDPHPERTLAFLQEAVKIAPCYYVTGNHEPRLADCEAYLQSVEDTGVILLRSEAVTLERDEQQLNLLGVDDYTFFPGNNGQQCVDAMIASLEPLAGDGYDILLFHRPELVPELWELDLELILSGHAHGGQFRLPFLGGLYAPDQGFLPKYDGGVYSLEDRTLVLSRGLGNSLFPFRLNNPPEVLIITVNNQ